MLKNMSKLENALAFGSIAGLKIAEGRAARPRSRLNWISVSGRRRESRLMPSLRTSVPYV